jgi:hypothetical protein
MLRPYVGSALTPVHISTSDKSSFALEVYPNPANNLLNTSLPEHINKQDVIIEIYAINGQKVYRGDGAASINVSTYQTGFYTIKAFYKETQQISISKFVVYH